MAGFRKEQTIQQPPERVFAYMTDHKNAPQVMDNVLEMEKLTDGPVGVGTCYCETRDIRGKKAQTNLEVTRYEPPHRYSVCTTAGGYQINYHYTIQPVAEGSHIELVCDVQASGLKKLMAPMVASMMRKEDGYHLTSLKEILEENDQVASGGGEGGFA